MDLALDDRALLDHERPGSNLAFKAAAVFHDQLLATADLAFQHTRNYHASSVDIGAHVSSSGNEDGVARLNLTGDRAFDTRARLGAKLALPRRLPADDAVWMVVSPFI
jgi:hypothetical protein